MPPYGNEPASNGRRRDVGFAALVVVLALSTSYLSEGNQQAIANGLRATVLRPFIGMQRIVRDASRRAGQIDALTAQLDSLTAVLSTHASLRDENRTLRALLGLAERGGPRFVPATVLRPGTPGSQRTFLVDVGAAHGVAVGAPVVAPHGLVGRINEVQGGRAVGMDWSHPDFRVSAMLVDGTTYGIVAPSPGGFREDDRLVMRGTAYTLEIPLGTPVVTSGLGGVFPRGIPIGKVDEVLETAGAWRRSFWIEPMVEVGSVTHVLVLTTGADGDLSGVWPADSLLTAEEAIRREEGVEPGP